MPAALRYRDPTLQDRLAAEYVLGTLHGGARQRFERLLIELPALREHVHGWERHLNTLAWALPPQAPHRRVWRNIQRRIGAPPRARTAWFGWPLAAFAGAAAAAVMAIYIVLLPPPAAPGADYLAMIAERAERPLWSVSADNERGEITVTAIGDIQPLPQRDRELWLLPPASGARPVSLGLLPTSGTRTYPLPAGAGRIADAALAVSLEPPGGSPTGQPTGPVIHQARLFPVVDS